MIHIFALQNRKFYLVGQLMAMSIGQEGSGFPYFSRSVYKYLCGVNPMNIEVEVEDVPDFDVKNLLHKVS